GDVEVEAAEICARKKRVLFVRLVEPPREVAERGLLVFVLLAIARAQERLTLHASVGGEEPSARGIGMALDAAAVIMADHEAVGVRLTDREEHPRHRNGAEQDREYASRRGTIHRRIFRLR